MDEAARREQDRRYESAELRWPVSPEDWERVAQETLERRQFDYIAAGAEGESTVRENLAAFGRWVLRPRMLRGNEQRDLSVEVLGARSPVPFMLAPVGVLSLAHPDAEVAAGQAAAATGVPMIVSSASTRSLEEIAEAMGDAAARWFQLYWVRDWEVAGSFVKRAETAGYGAIVLTVDTLTLSFRDRDMRNRFLPFIEGEGIGEFLADPVFEERLGRAPTEDPVAAGVAMVGMFPNLALKWDDLAWLRERTSLPLLIKGLLTGEDAAEARDRGVDGIIVSNHGGRQVGGAIATLDALPEVREAVGEGFPVLMDSGVRRGSDVLKALALGADAVLIGRQYAYGLAVAGRAGVEQVIRQLWVETDLATALVGLTSPRDIDASFLRRG